MQTKNLNGKLTAPIRVVSSDLLGWLRVKLAEAEHSLKSREAMANIKPMTDEELEQIKALPGTRMTKGRKLSKAALKEIEMEPLRHKRIAVKCRREVEMFKATIAAISQHNVPDQGRRAGDSKTL